MPVSRPLSWSRPTSNLARPDLAYLLTSFYLSGFQAFSR
uniref:Uncharacterized protein n=1 Tax=Picea glauca TaxID=3330 RepID=A0A117NH47_PICGL|nr:hypothetical protein ABT39_MTgene4776 [Picea glauca]